MNSLIFIVHWNVEGKERSKGNHDLRMGLGNGFGRWIEEKSEENKVSFQVFTCYFQEYSPSMLPGMDIVRIYIQHY